MIGHDVIKVGFGEYCEILFIRGDPIFVVFVVGLAHEFTIPRIMNTTLCTSNRYMYISKKKFNTYMRSYIYLLSDKATTHLYIYL